MASCLDEGVSIESDALVCDGGLLILHDFGILEIDESFAFRSLRDRSKVGVVFCKRIKIDVALVIWYLLHAEGRVMLLLVEGR